MLSTGVDVPRIENIVFLRPVQSRILFEQMTGRGTRLCPEIHKTHFTVFDCFNGTLLEYFRKTTGITAEAPVKTTRSIREIVQAIANNEDRDYNIRVLSKRLHRISKNITQEGRLHFEYVLGCDLTEFAKTLHERLVDVWGTFVQGVLDIIKGSNVTRIVAERELQERVRLRYKKRYARSARTSPFFLGVWCRLLSETVMGNQVRAFRQSEGIGKK